MPKFQYTAMDGNGKEKKGQIEATSEDLAISQLKKDGLFPTSVRAVDAKSKKTGKDGKHVTKKANGGGLLAIELGSGGITTKDLTVITRQLAILLDAGLPLIRSLRTLERQTRVPAVRRVLGDCATSVEGGATFSEALAKHPKSFDKLYLNMVRAGEAAGAMESILNRLAEFMEKAARILGKVKSAMIYPSVVLSVAILITAGLMIFIVPQFEKIFKDMLGKDATLPSLTLFVVAISNFLQQGLGIFAVSDTTAELSDFETIMQYVEGPVEIVIGIVLLIVMFKVFVSTDFGRFAFDQVKFRAPMFGPIISKTAISRFARTLGTLLSSGVPVLNALQIVKETAGNEVVSRAVQKIHDAVKEGEGMSGPLAATNIFPAMVVSMIEVGEETGKLPEMLAKIADTYEEEVDNAVGALTSIIEPVMIVGLAVIVGTIVISLFMPMIEIIKKLSG